MFNIDNIIKESINSYINEVRYIDTTSDRKKDWKTTYQQQPIKDNETIRVYHGTNLETALRFAMNGISGQEKANRNYSYEMGMNPAGLFVTTNFETAKYFSYDSTANVILEFTAKASDLDTPVWNGDNFFSPGSNPQPFSSEEERNVMKQKYQDMASKDEDEYVSKSDNPAMAYRIFKNNEHQALFVGNINPNQIKRFWVKEKGEKQYIPLSRRDFIKKFGETEFSELYNGKYKIKKSRIYNANEDCKGMDDFIEHFLINEYGLEKYLKLKKNNQLNDDIEGLKEFFDDNDESMIATSLKELLYPKQIKQLMGEDFYQKYFNPYNF